MADAGASSLLNEGEADSILLSSPAQSSPTFTRSASNSSSSPPEPTTPPTTARSRTRYPDLGRVPLHRRGTSKTYEALEDLLKEAGYKETRIFTPETERAEVNASRLGVRGSHDDKRLSVKDGMEAVVGFFAGLIPNATTTSKGAPSEDSLTRSPQAISPPDSPLAQRYAQRSATRTSYESSTLTSSIESLNPHSDTHHSVSRSNSPAPTIMHYQQPPLIIRNASHSRQPQKQPSRNSITHQSNNNIASPRPSRAGAYLRHMSSVQTMPERPSSTPVHLFGTRPRIQLNDSDVEAPGSPYTYHRRGNGEGEGEDEQPPLPPSWLETVARAVLFGGSGAYVGGPANFPVPEQPRHASGSAMPKSPRVQVLRPTRSSLSQVSSRRTRQRPAPRSGLSDQTNATTFLAPAPPALFSKLESGRAGRSVVEVSKTRVMCRSAPGSRSGSITRGAAGDRKERFKERGRDRRTRGDKDRVPSLARTQTEGDVWSRGRVSLSPSSAAHRYYSGLGAKPDSDGGGGGGGGGHEDLAAPSSDDDDDEGELDLARILVPPKRQNSIKSLRKHLVAESASGAQATLKNIAGAMIPGAARAGRGGVNVVSGGPPSVAQRRAAAKGGEDADWDGEVAQEWGTGWVRKGRGSEDDEMESFTGFVGADRPRFGSGRRGSGKARMGFNSTWSLTGS